MANDLSLYLELAKKIKKVNKVLKTHADALSHLITQFELRTTSIQASLNDIQTALVNIERKEDTLMSQVAQDFESLRTAIDTATNAVAQKISDLSGQITNSMSDAEVASLKSEFQATADRLNQLAADPSNPVPTV